MTETYGQRVARLYDEQGMTQKEFAAKAGIPLRTLQSIESGATQNPRTKTRRKIDKALQLGPAEETVEDWPREVQAFLATLGAFLMTMPENDRLGFIHEETARIMKMWRQHMGQ